MLGLASQLKIERFNYDEANPGNDRMELSLLKGGLRSASGSIGKRSPARAELHTPLGTIGIGSATVVVEYAPPVKVTVAYRPVRCFAMLAELDRALVQDPSSQTLSDASSLSVSTQSLGGWQLAQNAPSPPGGGGVAPGLYAHVIDGLIQLSNRGGVQQFAAGQFGFTASIVQPPVVVPNNPGIQFSPPPAFSSSTSGGGGGSSNSAKPKTVDCEVR